MKPIVISLSSCNKLDSKLYTAAPTGPTLPQFTQIEVDSSAFKMSVEKNLMISRNESTSMSADNDREHYNVKVLIVLTLIDRMNSTSRRCFGSTRIAMVVSQDMLRQIPVVLGIGISRRHPRSDNDIIFLSYAVYQPSMLLIGGLDSSRQQLVWTSIRTLGRCYRGRFQIRFAKSNAECELAILWN